MRAQAIRTIIAVLGVALVAGVSLASLTAGSDPRIEPSPYPDEPVGDFPRMRYESRPDTRVVRARDEQRARAAALRDPDVHAAMGSQRARVVMLRAYGLGDDIPAADPCRGTTCIDVTIYLYDTDETLDVFVRPSGQVVRVERGVGQPPLSAAERRRAHRLAEADPDVAVLLDGRPHTHPAVLTKPMWPPGVCDRHRCGTVLFMLGDFARTGIGRQLSVAVDLSDGNVVSRTEIECTPVCRVGWGA